MPGMRHSTPNRKTLTLWLVMRCAVGARADRWLVPDWRQAWRFASVLAAVLLVLASLAQAHLLPLLQPLFAPETWPLVTAGFGVAIAVLRLLRQGLLTLDLLQPKQRGPDP